MPVIIMQFTCCFVILQTNLKKLENDRYNIKPQKYTKIQE